MMSLNFPISIEPKEGVTCEPNVRSYNLKVRTKGGVKIDFSTGFFAIFGDNLIDRSYRYVPEGTDVKIARNRAGDNWYGGLGALMHIYGRNGKEFQPAGCFGVSTRDLDKLNIHFGGSLIFGSNQRLVFSSGVTLAKVKLLSEEYEVGQVLDPADAPAEIPTQEFNRLVSLWHSPGTS